MTHNIINNMVNTLFKSNLDDNVILSNECVAVDDGQHLYYKKVLQELHAYYDKRIICCNCCVYIDDNTEKSIYIHRYKKYLTCCSYRCIWIVNDEIRKKLKIE
jgi:acetone carboxylase gamma subunit